MSDHQPKRAAELLLLAQVAVLGIPRARAQRLGQARDDPLLLAGVEQRPHRLRAAHRRIEQALWTLPERLEEAVRAVARRGDGLHLRAPTEGSRDRIDRGKSRALLGQPLAQVL